MAETAQQVPNPYRTTNDLIWEGVEAPREEFGRLQPPWPIPEKIAIKADIGHHYRAPDVIRISLECLDAGAGAVHLHVRDDDGKDTGDIGLWREVVGEIRRQAGDDVVIDSGLRGDSLEERLLHIREGLFDVVALLPSWDPRYLEYPIKEAREAGVSTEIVCWDATDISLAKSGLIDTGLFDRPARWLLVPSTPYYGMPMPTPELMVRGAMHMVDLVRAVDPEGIITFSAAGRPGSYFLGLAVLLGLHIRPGLGETHWRWPHSEDFAEDAVELIQDAADLSKALGRTPADSAEFRALTGMPARRG
ncbi:MAG TPA: 3-keto-5-aminohexanoate cleavage protein [Solirubrobacterales bacterium]|nr:3-keto-5-aminohexanoate cleavage protein [Solirubrobacterales bacterium]